MMSFSRLSEPLLYWNSKSWNIADDASSITPSRIILIPVVVYCENFMITTVDSSFSLHSLPDVTTPDPTPQMIHLFWVSCSDVNKICIRHQVREYSWKRFFSLWKLCTCVWQNQQLAKDNMFEPSFSLFLAYSVKAVWRTAKVAFNPCPSSTSL